MKRKQFLKTLALGSASLLLPPFVTNKSVLEAAQLRPNINEWSRDKIYVSWIGHSTVLISFYGIKILTDPILFDKIGLYFLGEVMGPYRYTKPALQFSEIPQPDIVLISHAHMDHCDYKSLKELTDKFPNKIELITSFRTKDVVNDLKFKSITELDWKKDCNSNGIKFTAYEVEHFGWRFPWEKDRSRGYMNGRSYNSYLMEYKDKKIFFGGDTRFTEKLKILKDKEVDIAIMPIGAYNPWHKVHCNPEEALEMASWMGTKFFVPVHYYTFKQGSEPRNEPLKRVLNSIGNYSMKLSISKIGETFIH